MPPTTGVPGRSGRRRCATRDRRRARRRARESLHRDILYYTGSSGSPTSNGPRRGAQPRHRDPWRLPLHGQRRQRRRLGPAGRVPRRCLGRRSAGRLLRYRAGLGAAGLPMGCASGQRLRVAAAARRRCAELFDGFRVDHLVGFYRTFVARTGRHAPRFIPPEKPAQRAQGERLLTAVQGAWRLRHRRGSRDRPRFRPRVAGPPRGPRPEGACAGNVTGRRTTEPFMDPAGVSRGVGRDQRHARHRDDGRVVGRDRGGRRARRCWLCRSCGQRASARTSRFPTGCATPCSGYALRRRLRPAARPRAGHLRLARPHQRPRRCQRARTGPGGCPGRSIASPPSRSRWSGAALHPAHWPTQEADGARGPEYSSLCRPLLLRFRNSHPGRQ